MAVGGALGAVARYAIGGWVQGNAFFPYGTLAVNVAGSFILGLVMAGTHAGFVSNDARLFLGVGLLGAFTTFSTFSFETFRLIENQEWLLAAANTLLNVGLALFAVFAARFLVYGFLVKA